MLKPWVVQLLAWPLGLGAAFCILVLLFQRSLMYFPARASEPELLARARALGLQPWRDRRGSLIGWRSPHPLGKPQGRMVVLQGNAGFALDRAAYAQALQAPALSRRWEVLLLEYPGYGSRSGSPSETSFVAAALEALDGLKDEGSLPTVLLGESLGSGIAARCAQARPVEVTGVFLVTPLTSTAEVARVHYPMIPAFLIRDRLDAVKALRDLRIPVAVLVAERDEVIPPAIGTRLFEGYAGPKRLWIARGGSHNDWDARLENPLWQEVSEFLLGTRPL